MAVKLFVRLITVTVALGTKAGDEGRCSEMAQTQRPGDRKPREDRLGKNMQLISYLENGAGNLHLYSPALRCVGTPTGKDTDFFATNEALTEMQ